MSTRWKGIALDWGTTIPSVFDPKEDKDVVKSSVLWIVLTGLQERVMNPTFGSRLASMVFNPNDLDSLNEVKDSVREAINTWDDRIEFVDFTANANGNNLDCTISYRLKIDEIHNDVLSVPFTLSEGMISN